MKKYIGFEEPLLLQLVRKHAVSELEPLIATLTVLYRKEEKITIIITQGVVHPELLYYLLCGKV